MTENLIAVEGHLRLPTLRPLTHPSLTFGRQWLPTSTRPARSLSEIGLFGARFVTGYVAALHSADSDAPYSPVSLWGVFLKEDTSRGMLKLKEADAHTPAAPDTPVKRIPLAVGVPMAAGARKSFFSKPVAAAIAIASAGFILWLLFGTEPRSSRKTASSAPDIEAQVGTPSGASSGAPEADRPKALAPRIVEQTTKVNPVIARTDSLPAVAKAPPIVATAATLDSRTASSKPEPAPDPSAAKARADVAAAQAAKRETLRMEAARREAERLETAQRAAAKREAKKQELAAREAAKREARKRQLAKREMARREALAREEAKREAVRRHAIARAAERREAMARQSAEREAAMHESMAMARESARRGAAAREAMTSRRDVMTSARDSGMRRSAWGEPVQQEPVVSERPRYVRAAPADIARSQPARSAESLNAAALYELLQHSPTLDSNAPSRGSANAQ